MPGLRRRACSRAGIIIVGFAGALLAGACSGSSGHAAVAANASSAAPSSSSGAGFQAYRDCLSQHGVTLPSRNRNQSDSNGSGASADSTQSDNGNVGRGNGGGFGGGNGQFSLPPGVDQATFNAAQQACANLRPAGNGGGRGGAAGAAYRSCLADHGVTVPSTSSGGPPPSIDRNDPNFAAANQACRALLPGRGSSNSSSSTASSTSG
ncbi:MAG TPA: hypothetical protein VFV00_01215 [Acidimicrobiales bacterium]|nr:hypothetical protein [Acidimicrobiales bacterium]